MDKAAILAAAAASGLPREVVSVPEFGDGVTLSLQGMTGTQRDAWEKSLIVGKGQRRDVNTENIRARLVVKSLFTDDWSARMFTDAEAAVVGTWRVDVLQRLFTVAQRLSGVSDADVDELGKSSAPTAGSASPTS